MQQQHAQQIREHMAVEGSDGGHVGTVDKVEGDRIKLTKKDDPDGSGAHHHHLPLSAVASVAEGRVRLNMPAEQAKRAAVAGGAGNAGGPDKDMGAQGGVTGAGTMEPGQLDMAGGPSPRLGEAGGGQALRDGVADTDARAGAAGMAGDTAPGTVSGREGGGGGASGRSPGG